MHIHQLCIIAFQYLKRPVLLGFSQMWRKYLLFFGGLFLFLIVCLFVFCFFVVCFLGGFLVVVVFFFGGGVFLLNKQVFEYHPIVNSTGRSQAKSATKSVIIIDVLPFISMPGGFPKDKYGIFRIPVT